MSARCTEGEVSQELAGLAEFNLDALRRRWRRLTGRPAPEHITKQLLIRLVAYRIQVMYSAISTTRVSNCCVGLPNSERRARLALVCRPWRG